MVREPADFLWAAYNIWTLASGIFRCLVLSFARLGSNRTPSTLQPKSQQFALPPRALPGEPKGQEGRTENLGPTLAGVLMVTSFCGFRGKGCTWGQGGVKAAGSRLLASGFRHFRKIHVRSPELFDELVLADGKKEAWAPRANKITGQWFDQIKNLKDVSANLMFLKSEDGSIPYSES